MLLLYLLNSVQYPSGPIRYKKLFEFFVEVNNFLVSSDSDGVPSIIQNVTLAILSILIPLAVAILTDLLEKKSRKEHITKESKESKLEDFLRLDLHVILDHVFKIKSLIFSTLTVFLPLVFWDKYPSLRIVEIFVSTIGILWLIQTIINVYYWTKGDSFNFRLNYLKKVTNFRDLDIVWESVWASGMDRFQENKFFPIFSKKVDELMKNDKV